MPITPEELAQFLEAERASLRSGLPARLAEMESLWAREEWPTLRRLAHSLYGSAGTFGFKEVGAACKSLELALEAFERSGSTGDRRAGEDALRQVRSAIGAVS